jgi:hypothetical protein
MVGCGFNVKPDNEPKRMPSAAVMKLCLPLTPLDGSTMGDLVNKISEMSLQYKECALLHKELVEWVDRSPK